MTPFNQNTPAPRRRSFPKTGEVCAEGAGGGGTEPFSYGGMRFYASDLLPTDTVEDWSEVRSPSRAARRRRQGHPQRIIYRQVSRDEVFVMGDRMVMPPHLLAKLRAKLDAGFEFAPAQGGPAL